MDKNKQNVVIKEVEDKEEKNTRKIYGIIYAIVNNVNGKMYIGQTTQESIYARYRINKDFEPIKRLGEKHHNEHLRKAINKYGYENFEIIEVLAKGYSFEELNELEKFYIEKYSNGDPSKLYNMTSGGDKGYEITNEFKEKLRDFYNNESDKDKEARKNKDRDAVNNYYANESEKHKKMRSDSIKKSWQNPKTRESYMNGLLRGIDNPWSLPIVCITFVEENINYPKIFESIKDVNRWANENEDIFKVKIGINGVSRNCSGKGKSSGILKSGLKLKWKFLKDLDEDFLLKIKECENDENQLKIINLQLANLKNPNYLKEIKEREEKNKEIGSKIAEKKKGIKNYNLKIVYSSTLNKIFMNVREAFEFTKNKKMFISPARDIGRCCDELRKSSGKTIDGEEILWKYFYKCDENELNSALKNEIDIDKIKIINEQLEKLKNPEYCKELYEKILIYKKNRMSRNKIADAVYSPTLNKVFLQIKIAFNATRDKNKFISCSSQIANCCKNKVKFTGKTITGEKIKWKYLSECDEEELKNALKCEDDEVIINAIEEELKKFIH